MKTDFQTGFHLEKRTAALLILAALFLGFGIVQFQKNGPAREQLRDLQSRGLPEGRHALSEHLEAVVHNNREGESIRKMLMTGNRLEEVYQSLGGTYPIRAEQWYFDVLSLVDRLRSAAEESRVMILSPHAFGLEEHIDAHRIIFDPSIEENFGKIGQRLSYVQHKELEILMRALLEAGPARVENVVVEQIQKVDQNDFHPQPEASASLEGDHQLVCLGYTVEFEGKTESLRAFLNKLSSCSTLWVVEDVQVFRPVRQGTSSNAVHSAFSAPVRPTPSPMETLPVVKENDSRFRLFINRFLWVDQNEDFSEYK